MESPPLPPLQLSHSASSSCLRARSRASKAAAGVREELGRGGLVRFLVGACRLPSLPLTKGQPGPIAEGRQPPLWDHRLAGTPGAVGDPHFLGARGFLTERGGLVCGGLGWLGGGVRVRVYCLVLGSRGGLGSNRMSGLLNTRCFFRKARRRAGRQSAGPRSLGQGGCENYTSQHAALLAQGRGWGGLRSSSGKPFSCSCSSCAQLRAAGRASSRRRWRRTESSQGCGRRCPPQRLPSGLPCVAWSRARRTSALCTLSTQRALACLPVRVYTLRGTRLLTSSHSPRLRRDL